MVLQKLHELGARRVLVTGTGPLGCVPAELAMRGRNGQCAPELQQAALLFNPQLVQMLKGLNRQYGSNVFIAANTDLMHRDFINDPHAYGNLNHMRANMPNAYIPPYRYVICFTLITTAYLNRSQLDHDEYLAHVLGVSSLSKSIEAVNYKEKRTSDREGRHY